MTVKPPKGVRSAGNLAGCVGRSRLRIGHESFRFVRNGLESFLCRHQTNIRGRHGTQHAKEVVGREGRRTGEAPSGGRRGSGTVVGVCLAPVGGIVCAKLGVYFRLDPMR